MAAFEFSEPDRVPCWLGASPEFRELMRVHLGLKDDESLSRRIGDDFRRMYTRYQCPAQFAPTSNLVYADATYRTPFGIERHGYGYGMPLNSPLEHAATLKEIHDYPWPDPAWMDPSQIRADALAFQGQYAILGGDWSPFWHDAIDLLTFERFCYLMYDRPELIDAILEHIVDYYFKVSARIFEAAGDVMDIFFIGNDFGSHEEPPANRGQNGDEKA